MYMYVGFFFFKKSYLQLYYIYILHKSAKTKYLKKDSCYFDIKKINFLGLFSHLCCLVC